MAQKEAFLTGRQRTKPDAKSKGNEKGEEKHTLLGMTKPADNPEVPQCPLCKGKHSFWKCQKYKRLEPVKKFEYVKSLRLCFNCFSDAHMSSKCTLRGACQECREGEKKHHPSLHKYFLESAKKDPPAKETPAKDGEGVGEKEKDAGNQVVGMLRGSPKRVYTQIVQV